MDLSKYKDNPKTAYLAKAVLMMEGDEEQQKMLIAEMDKIIAAESASEEFPNEAVLEVRGLGVYEKLRFETGVHRIQRVPATEKSGRVHTSTASVAILPIRKKHTFDINPGDIEMEFSRAGGAGGQNVKKVETPRASGARELHL